MIRRPNPLSFISKDVAVLAQVPYGKPNTRECTSDNNAKKKHIEKGISKITQYNKKGE